MLIHGIIVFPRPAKTTTSSKVIWPTTLIVMLIGLAKIGKDSDAFRRDPACYSDFRPSTSLDEKNEKIRCASISQTFQRAYYTPQSRMLSTILTYFDPEKSLFRANINSET
ncbi:hypothetical protein KIN20_025413 [Parelaphostrongylus tenuis]|uniref:Uncharacterized protein n=1 Tax=Parelaphostrongylus tenuis TaxID=148309 RepID=A0AAD5NBU9_PARTN|nr:hypothetical protein KIN20_025413 [Parelaphostrongylus tenuis]